MQEQFPTPSEKTEKRRRFLINFTFFLVIFALSVIFVRYALGALFPFVIALGVTLLLRPLVKFCKNKLKIKNRLLEPTLVIIFYCTIGVLAALLALELVKSIGSIISYLPSFYTQSVSPTLSSAIAAVNNLLKNFDIQYTLSTGTILSTLGGAISSISGSLISGISSVALSTPTFILNIIITIVATVFMLMDLDVATRFAIHQLSEEKAKLVRDVVHHLGFVVKKYILSYALIMFITFLEIWLGLTIFGVTNAALVAAIIAVFDILPVVGASLIILPWAAVSLLTGNFGLAIGLIVLLAILAVVRNIIEPKIIGTSVGMHPLLTLFSMLLGNFIYGGVGILLLPITVALFQTLNREGVIHLYKHYEEEEPEIKKGKISAVRVVNYKQDSALVTHARNSLHVTDVSEVIGRCQIECGGHILCAVKIFFNVACTESARQIRAIGRGYPVHVYVKKRRRADKDAVHVASRRDPDLLSATLCKQTDKIYHRADTERRALGRIIRPRAEYPARVLLTLADYSLRLVKTVRTLDLGYVVPCHLRAAPLVTRHM